MNYVKETMLFLDSHQGLGKSENFSVNYDTPIQLDPNKRYIIGLFSSDIWYSWYNIDGTNNLFKYNNKALWKELKLQPGAYNIIDIDREIKRLIQADGDIPENISISPNYNTLKCRITLKGSYKIDLTTSNSIRSVLGFTSREFASDGVYDGKYNVNISNIMSLLIRCSIVGGSYVNGCTSDCVFSFSPAVSPGHLISIRPSQILYVPINCISDIPRITMRITDQSNNEVNLNGERVTYHLYLKQAN